MAGTKNKPQKVNVLMIEDDDVDYMGIERIFKESHISSQLYRAKDGYEALAMLRGADGYTALERPYLILLDIKMPGMDGIEFLKEIRKDPEHKSAVIFVFTTSKHDEDREAAYKYNVAGYITKSGFGNSLIDTMQMIDAYSREVEFPG
ncbi:MAG: response regulator [Candidatus Margulisiibacteriota bacterium]